MALPENLFKNYKSLILHFFISILGMYLLVGFSGCDFSSEKNISEPLWDTLEVSASAYNSLEYQTGSGDANITAWGDTIKPGMKIIAISRDLLDKGLDYNTPVRIEGFEGTFLVKDKMHSRWKNKIDIYMGENVKKARKWGRKKIKIYYLADHDSVQNSSG